MIVGRVACGGAAVPSLRAAPYPVAARRRAVTVLVSPLHIEEPAPAALVGVEFFFLFAATLSCGLWRYSGVMFFLLSAISWPWHATLERMSATQLCWRRSRGGARCARADRSTVAVRPTKRPRGHSCARRSAGQRRSQRKDEHELDYETLESRRKAVLPHAVLIYVI